MTFPIVYPAGYDHPVASAARHLLDTIVRVFDENNIELPVRRVITIGSLAVDTPVLGVMFGGVTIGPPGNELNTPFRGDAPRSITLNVELWRVTDAADFGGSEPSAEVISAQAETAMNDTWWLMEAATQSDQSGAGSIVTITPSAPQGERHGVSMIVEQQIP